MKFLKNTVLIFSFILLLFFLLGLTPGENDKKAELKAKMKKYQYWENPRVCSGCHWDKFTDWSRSQMAKGYSGDFFQAQYFKLVLEDVKRDSSIKDAHEGCIGCHSPSAYLSNDIIPPKSANPDNHWQPGMGSRYLAERGIFCDFCHTVEGYEGDTRGKDPFNHNYFSAATENIDPKRGDLAFPWSPHHETQLSELFESAEFCATCHNELNPFDVWVKATHLEYLEGPYPAEGIVCQDCHMQHRGGKPAKMGPTREHNSEHWFGGGFSTFVEGAASVTIHLDEFQLKTGENVEFNVEVQNVAAGHKFPTGSSEERDVWLHLGIYNENGEELEHIKIQSNPDDPDDKYFITSNDKIAYPTHSKYSEPFERDCLVEGDRLYHSTFLDSDGNVTYAQWYAVKDIENRIAPLEKRFEHYKWTVPESLAGKNVFLRAVLNYRRMPDSFAKYLGIKIRPKLEVGRDEVRISVR